MNGAEEGTGMCPGTSLHLLGRTVFEGAGLRLKSGLLTSGYLSGENVWSQYPRRRAHVWSDLQACFLTSLKGVFDVIHFHLGSRHPENSFML